MKTMKRIGALMCATALVFSLAACGGGNDSTDNGDIAGIMAAANEKAATAASMEASMTMDIGMSMALAGESYDFDMLIGMDMVMFNEPMKMKIDMTMDMGDMNAMIGLDGPMTTEMYAVEEEGVLTLYTDVGGYWSSEAMDLGEIERYNPQASMDLYLNSADSFKSEGSSPVNGVAATKYTGVITGTALEEVMNASGMLDSINNMGLSADGMDFAALYQDMGDLPISVWIDEAGYPIQYEMDMTAIMTKMYEKIMADSGYADAGMEMSISKALISMVVTNYDNAADFELPADIAG